MQRLSDHELEVLLNNLESDRVERKESWTGSAPEKSRQAICAFANDLANHQLPGVLFIGAKDNGAASCLSVTDQLLLTLADIKTEGKTVPPPTLTVEKRTLKGAEMAVVCVWPADAPPVRYEGRIWIRVGPSRRLAGAQDERILNEKRRYRDLHFEAHPISSCPLSELSQPMFEQEYLPNAVAPDVLAANSRSYEQQLASCGMIASVSEPVPTVLGVLCLGKSPRTWIAGDYIQFLRIQGVQLSDPVIDQAEIDGTVGTMLRRLDEKLTAHLTTSVDFTSQTTEIRSSPYPMVALQQLARNAVMHRTYENTNAPVRLYWFDDRIEIINPGGPYGSVTAQNFGQPGRADYRNPQLAGAFKVLGFAQRFGAGIALARQALAQNGNPLLSFEIESNFIGAIIRRKS
ncbi:MAG TPA: ATP-binding protein [Opitutaceae bacterium]|jgi:ATP-dependent DNA helicase RecG|nr:ATP-binding protein [Opitutaceae bacterium]